MTGSEKLRLPPGYRLDRGDPDVWTLRRPEGWVVAYFSARGATKEALIEAMGPALTVVSARDARRFFAPCGYPHPGASTMKGVLKAMAYPLKIDHEVVAFDVNRICSYSEGWVADALPRLHIEVETMPGTAQHLPVPYQLIDTGLTWCCQRG